MVRQLLVGRSRITNFVFRRAYKTLRIGDVVKQIQPPKQKELVPKGYAKADFTQGVLQTLKWMAQKEQLKQDVFLVGVPGPSRRRLIMTYLELIESEYEYLALTRDVTEADIKQRREVRAGSAVYLDQCAVRAALHGRILILDGIEKAERNVLPILNNLLENREMQLDDGRFLVAPEKYDKMLKSSSREELAKKGLVRVHERFRVVALGLPVPKFRGHPLDPPLRSRFQAHHVKPASFKDCCETLYSYAPNVKPEKLNQVASLAYGMLADESTDLALPEFPIDNLASAAQIWNINPALSSEDIVELVYPYTAFLRKDGVDNVRTALKSFNVPMETKGRRDAVVAKVDKVERYDDDGLPSCRIRLLWNGKPVTFEVSGGLAKMISHDGLGDTLAYISTRTHDYALCKTLLMHAVGDFCIIGAKGCGKTVLVQKFADTLAYDVVPVVLYQDMTSRDLLQQRRMLPNGDTVWQYSPLVEAALAGKLAILDGIHRVHHSTLNVLNRLIHEREVELFDGTRLLERDRYERIKADTLLSDEDLAQRKIFPIHPSFRIIALAEPPNLHDSGSGQQWLTPELLTMFLYHEMNSLNAADEMKVISNSVDDVSEEIENRLLDFVETLRQSKDPNLQTLAASLSTRQLIRIMKRISKYSDESLRDLINKACLSRFLPQLTKAALNQALEESEILDKDTRKKLSAVCEAEKGSLRIGSTTAAVQSGSNPELVPDILFYDTPEHLRIMEDMLRDFLLGEHLLLIGNQGVGKNKIADRFLQLLNLPRQYIQLHRDTTVQTLTLQSTVVDGIVVYDDSPLVKAVKNGYVLVIDEGDKAPTHVTCILKSLLEAGEMYLADGRYIKPPNYRELEGQDSTNIIRMHPDFRIVVLANRPGFPFLGNDFYSALGDLFSCHVVDNPSMESELSMLKRYGPDVEEETLAKLARAFSELRDSADQGLLNYPYSTRELVNIVKHLQQYKKDGVPQVVANVFDFDAYDKDVEEAVYKVLAKHGFPTARRQRHVEIKLAERFAIGEPHKLGRWGVSGEDGIAQKLSLSESTLKLKGPASCDGSVFPMDRLDARTDRFTEQRAYWQLPLTEVNIISDVVASSNSGDIYVASVNPICVHRINAVGKSGTTLDLHGLFSNMMRRSSFKPRIKLASLGPQSSFKDSVLVHEELTNTLAIVDFANRQYYVVDFSGNSSLGKSVDAVAQMVKGLTSSQEAFHRLLPAFVHDKQKAIVYQKYGTRINFIDFNTGRVHSLDLSAALEECHCVAENILLVESMDSRMIKVEYSNEQPLECTLSEVSHGVLDLSRELRTISSASIHELMLQRCLGEKIISPSRLLAMGTSSEKMQYYGLISIGFPELAGAGDIFGFPRPAERFVNIRAPDSARLLSKFVHRYSATSILPQLGQLVNALPVWKIPEKAIKNRDVNLNQIAGALEIVDFPNRVAMYLPVPAPKFAGIYTSWQCTLMEAMFTLSPYGSEGVVTADSAGGVRLWETSLGGLQNSLAAWKRMIGAEQEPVQLSIEKTDGDLSKLDEPKHGITDPTGAPHVGGNTFAGGSGGYNTAGLGGVGGPYRLDIGQTVYQLPDSFKDNVPDHIRQKAREMAQKAYNQRLKEIQMSKFDAEMYDKFRGRVDKQISQLRVILDSLQAKGKERQWTRHQTSGDFDDGKLIEGMTGEKNVYRRRAEKEPEPGTPQMKPKRLRLCVDVSGSMYRFNGYDGRLQRSMESCLMLIEALKGHEQKFKYDIVGHSGDDAAVLFLDSNNPPKNEKERLDVLKFMLAHSQYCMSGDNTLESTRLSVKQLANEEADERFVIVLSDANLDRYGISAAQFADAMTSDDRVNVFAVFIGSLGDQATRLKKKLPVSKAFVCTDTTMLPQILQNIFTSTIVSGGAD